MVMTRRRSFVVALLVIWTQEIRTALSLAALKSSPKLELYPFQKVGVKRLVEDRRVLLADEMGLGKTIQCIQAINVLQSTRSEPLQVLVICPKSVIRVWQDELDKWLSKKEHELEICVGTAKVFPQHLFEEISGGFILLINYEICRKHKALLQSIEYDCLICDEAHYLKSIESQRTQAILGEYNNDYGIRSEYLWLLTGTPIMNRPIELYPLLRAVDPKEWDSLDDFQSSYCDPRNGRWGMTYNGASNLGELSRRLNPVMIRRFKSDVLTELPPKIRSSVVLDNPEERRLLQQQEQQLVSQLMHGSRQDEQIIPHQQSRGSGLYDMSLQADLCSILGVDKEEMERFGFEKLMGIMAKVRQETALMKVPRAVELLKDAILSHKVVVFCHHRAVIHKLMTAFKNEAVCVMGGMNTSLRAEAVDQFQNNPNVRLFVGSIRAAGVGITLTASSHVVFLEFDWSPAVMQQAEDRCHRVTQKDSVQVQYFVFEGTIDAFLAQQLIEKQVTISQALDAPSDSTQNTSQRAVRSEAYKLEFGKYRGLGLDDIPQDYISFLVNTDRGAIWKSRQLLWEALFARGLVSEPPPSPSTQSNSKIAEVDYTFDFGKHKGSKWKDVPEDYLSWALREKIWKSRPQLHKALVDAGVVPAQE